MYCTLKNLKLNKTFQLFFTLVLRGVGGGVKSKVRELSSKGIKFILVCALFYLY